MLVGCGRKEEKPNVIFILLDAARADRFGCNGYERDTTPNIDALASEGVTFCNHFSNSTYTLASVPSYFYSRYFINPLLPADIRVPIGDPNQLFRTLDQSAISLAGVFNENGYHTVLFTAHPWLIPGQELVDDFDQYYPIFSKRSAYAKAGKVLSRVIKWLENAPPQPFFMYIHLMDTHFPHERQEETLLYADKSYDPRKKFDREGFPRGITNMMDGLSIMPKNFTDADGEYLNALYDGDLRYADTRLGFFLKSLKENGLYDNTLLIITADHGEYLGEHGFLQHAGLPWDAVTRVPLIMRLPGKISPQLKVTALTENVDILPTLMAMLALAAPSGKDFDGKSVFQKDGSLSPAREYIFTSDSIRSRHYKFIHDPHGSPDYLYNLDNDPKERHNLIDIEPEIARRLQTVMAARLLGPQTRFNKSVGQGTPRFPFSIPASEFQLSDNEDIEVVYRDTVLTQDNEILERARSAPVWIHDRMPGQYYLLGFNQAALSPLSISFPLPDGRYLVSVFCSRAREIQGIPASIFRIILPEADSEKEVKVDVSTQPGKSIFSLGEVEISGREFHARIEPSAGPSWIIIYYFGFEPLRTAGDKGARNNQDRQGRVKQLKALGYIQ